MKIVICGSMIFSKEMIEVKDKLNRLGHKVVLPRFTEEYAKMENIDKTHTESVRNKIEYNLIRDYFDEIKNSDAILVVNSEKKGIRGYVGGNSFLEMGFAYILKKPIFLFEEIPKNVEYADEINAMNPIALKKDLSKLKIKNGSRNF